MIRDILDLQEVGPEPLELFTADVSDAFLNLPVMESERGPGRGLDGQGNASNTRPQLLPTPAIRG